MAHVVLGVDIALECTGLFTARDKAYVTLLETIYADLAPLDPEGILRHERGNGRGCIARFDRMALEIRLIDVQECPRMDLAIAEAAVAVSQALVEDASTRAFFNIMTGFQFLLGRRAAIYISYEFVPSTDNFLLSDEQHTFGGGIRYSIGGRKEDVTSAR